MTGEGRDKRGAQQLQHNWPFSESVARHLSTASRASGNGQPSARHSRHLRDGELIAVNRIARPSRNEQADIERVKIENAAIGWR